MTSIPRTSRRLAAAAALASLTLAGLANLALAPAAWAQNAWPTKPVRIVVPFAPGGTTDILARAVAPELSKAFGQQFIIDNRAGAGGNVGADIVAKAAPDGYTLLMGTVGTHGINRALYPKMPFDPIKDFAPITMVAAVPNVMEMNAEKARALGIHDVKDFIRVAKERPGPNRGTGSGPCRCRSSS
jgi:tripartite-type tricarboxylate transporter receptor subunit TctC